MITEELLKEKGFNKQVFFYAIGGGEDEDDTDIFVRDNIVVFWDYHYKVWRRNFYQDISYVNGLNWEGEVINESDL